MADEAPRPDRTRKLAYDVSVNVVANLIAAAVVYLVAVIAGYVRKNPPLEVSAFLVIYTAVLVAVLVRSDVRSARTHREVVRAWIFLGATVVLTIAVTVGAFIALNRLSAGR